MPFSQAYEKLEKFQNNSKLSRAIFGGGCFWCMQGPFESMDGVEGVVLGYMGGKVKNPSYEQVSMGNTGHREVALVFYDPHKVTFKELLDTYWKFVDPTDPDGQFADKGSQYTTAIYYIDDEQKNTALEEIEQLNFSGKYKSKIVTEVLPESEFFPAEDYHQDYYKKQSINYKAYYAGSGRKAYVEGKGA